MSSSKKGVRKRMFYLAALLKNPAIRKEYEDCFKKCKDYDDCQERLKELFKKYEKKIRPYASYTRFIDACYCRAKREELLNEKNQFDKRAWIFRETEETQNWFRENWALLTFSELREGFAQRNAQKGQTDQDILNAAISMGLPKRSDIKKTINIKALIDAQRADMREWPSPQVFEISKEAWEKSGARVGCSSRFDWKNKGSRGWVIRTAMERAAVLGFHYNGLAGGLIDKSNVEERIAERLGKIPKTVRKECTAGITKIVLDEIANELKSVIPMIKKPADVDKKGSVEYVRFYIMTSLILDGYFGEEVARRLDADESRPDIVHYKQGGDETRLKGVGVTDEEKRVGQILTWLTLKKHRLPGQYASTGPDKEIGEEMAAVEKSPDFIIVGGHGVSISKPGGGEKKIPYISLPICSIPIARKPGEPSIALNQIGIRAIYASPNGKEKLIQSWSFRDLATNERQFVHGIKEGATELHRKIVELIKLERKGLRIGELHDRLDISGMSRAQLEEAMKFLIEPKALKRTTWSGLYQDLESGRYNMHLDWFQERLNYPWPYDKDYTELRRLVFGCLHAGYTTTDYHFVRYRFPEILEELDIQVLELVGDIVAGLKHHMVHRGQIIGNMNYTEQEILAGELLATVIYEVFVKRFEKGASQHGNKPYSKEELENLITTSLLLFIFIVGNHDAWQEESGIAPGFVFKTALILILERHIGAFLAERGFSAPALNTIIENKIVELPEWNAMYTFPGGLTTELFHPRMARTKTVSIRAEEALDFARGSSQLVDLANFHTTIVVRKWDPGIGERVATQAGTMVIGTDFEHGKMKTVDFGPVYVGVRARKERIFMDEHQFFPEPILKEPISKNTDINRLKDELKLLRCPISVMKK